MTYSNSEFTEKVKTGQVFAVKMQGQQVLGTYKDATKFKTYVPNNAKVVDLLEKHKIQISAEPEEDAESGWFSALAGWLPMLFFLFL